MPTYTTTLITLGVWIDIDPIETTGNQVMEDADTLIGQSYGSAADPLYNHRETATFHDFDRTVPPDGRIPLIAGAPPPNPQNWTTIGSDPTVLGADGAAIMYGTVTYFDGTTKDNVLIRIFQDHLGRVHLLPPPLGFDIGTEVADMTGKALQSITFTGVYSNQFNSILVDRYGLGAPTFPCFARGSLILTSEGEKTVESLRVGDLVITADAGPQPIRWIGSRKLSADDLKFNENLRPIRIKAGALGADLPRHDLLVSPQHRMLVRSKVVRRMCETDEALIAAKHLCGIEGISVAEDMEEVTYFHLLFDQHQIIIANGAETESLYLGTQSLYDIGAEAREEILTIFPDLAHSKEEPSASRHFLNGRRGRKLVSRHSENNMPLVTNADKSAMM